MKNSNISWTGNTFNPWEGCAKVSPGCLHCYAETRNLRFAGGANWGKGAPRRRTSPSNWREPVRWNLAAMEEINDYEGHKALHGGFAHYPEPKRPLVFCASLADWLDDEVPIEWFADLMTLVFDCGFLTWQMLTKRPENFRRRLDAAGGIIRNYRPTTEHNAMIAAWLDDWKNGRAPHNVWVGTSVEDQTRADERIPILLEIPAIIHFLSCEPLLSRVTFDENWLNNRLDETKGSLNWIIVGGESGPNSRRFELDWAEKILRECKDAGVACFIKQLGRNATKDGVPVIFEDPKGGDPATWPERLRVQEFPIVKTS